MCTFLYFYNSKSGNWDFTSPTHLILQNLMLMTLMAALLHGSCEWRGSSWMTYDLPVLHWGWQGSRGCPVGWWTLWGTATQTRHLWMAALACCCWEGAMSSQSDGNVRKQGWKKSFIILNSSGTSVMDLAFLSEGWTFLISVSPIWTDFTSWVFYRINRWRTCMCGEGKAFKARLSVWRLLYMSQNHNLGRGQKGDKMQHLQIEVRQIQFRN